MGFEYSGAVKMVETKSGKNGPYYRLNIPKDGRDWWLSSFTGEAAGLGGKSLRFNAVQKGNFWNLVDWEIIEGAPAAQVQAETGGNGKKDQWITTTALVKSGIEGGIIKTMDEARHEFYMTLNFIEAFWNKDMATVATYLGEPEEAQ